MKPDFPWAIPYAAVVRAKYPHASKDGDHGIIVHKEPSTIHFLPADKQLLPGQIFVPDHELVAHRLTNEEA